MRWVSPTGLSSRNALIPGRRGVRSPLSLPADGPAADGPAADSQPGRLRFAALGYALTVLLTGTNLATPLYAGY